MNRRHWLNDGTIILLLKPGKGDTTLPGNYRGIPLTRYVYTLTSTLSKLVEKIVHQEEASFLEKNESFSDSHYGFRKQRSCEDLM